MKTSKPAVPPSAGSICSASDIDLLLQEHREMVILIREAHDAIDALVDRFHEHGASAGPFFSLRAKMRQSCAMRDVTPNDRTETPPTCGVSKP